jgi:beta-glucosidase
MVSKVPSYMRPSVECSKPVSSPRLRSANLTLRSSYYFLTCFQHFIGNEQETNRLSVNEGEPPTLVSESVSSNIDDRTMHELYMWPFQDAIHAGTGTIMCSYQRLNNSYGCQNSYAMNGLLKTELGFEVRFLCVR